MTNTTEKKTMGKTALQNSILAIFAADTKTTKYLERRRDLSDEEFIDAALRQRPSNVKLKAFLEGRRKYLESVVPSETKEESDASWNAVDADANIEVSTEKTAIDKLREIFAKDSRTLKRINRNFEAGTDGLPLIEIALKARPNNKRVLELQHEWKYGKTEEVQSVTVEEEILEEPTFNPNKVKPDEVAVTTSPSKYKNAVIGKVKNIKDLKEIEKNFNVQEKLLEIFASDKGTHKALLKKIDQGLGDDDLIKMCLHRRPKNVKLKTFIKDLADFRETKDDLMEFEENDSINVEEISTQMQVDKISYVRNDNNNITMFINGEMEVINSEHPNFKRIIKCLESEKWSEVLPLIDVRKGIASLVYKQLEFKNDTLYHNGKELDGALVDFIIKMVHSGEKDVQPFMRFLHKLLKNPSKRAQKELYKFLAFGGIPINERGNILTYKRIRRDWTDIHSGKFDNSVGRTVSMERSQVDDRSDVTCSHGLHVCSYKYLSSFSGDRTVVCEVNPADVVSIPDDYHNAKMRCCKYTVLKEVKNGGKDILSEKPIYFEDK